MTDEYVLPPARAADLTPRQLAVAKLIAVHFTDQQIGLELRIRPSTVRVHIVAIAYRIHADQSRTIRTQIAEWWRRQLPGMAA